MSAAVSVMLVVWPVIAVCGFIACAITYMVADREEEKTEVARASMKVLIWPITLAVACAQMMMTAARGNDR